MNNYSNSGETRGSEQISKVDMTMDNFENNQPLRQPIPDGYTALPDEERAFNVRELASKILSRWWLILSIVIIGTSVTTVNVYRIKSIYLASGTIELTRKDAYKMQGMTLVPDMNTDIQTSIYLLQSRPLLEDVVRRLKLDKDPVFNDVSPTRTIWDVLNRRTSSVQALPKASPSATSAPSDEIELPAKTDSSKPGATTTTGAEYTPELSPYVGLLRQGLGTMPVPGARLIRISFTHHNPELAARIVNTIAEVFIDRSFRSEVSRFSDTSEWLDNTTRKLETQVREAEQTLSDFARQRGMLSSEGKDEIANTRLSTLLTEYMKAETNLILKESIYQQVLKGKIDQLPEALIGSNVGEMEKKLNDLNIEVAQLSVKFGARNPRVVEAQQQISTLQKQIELGRKNLVERIKSEYERAVEDERSLKSAFNKAKDEAVDQTQTVVTYGIYKQNVEITKKLYTDFLTRTAQANIQLAEQQRNVSLAEPAERPGTPVGPDRFRSISLAFLLSLLSGVGLVFLIDYLDNKIKTVDDLHRFTKLPTFGVIPAIGASAEQSGDLRLARFEGVKEIESSYSGSEAYRRLRTSILLANAGAPPRKILFTSSVAGEGKTTTCINVGITLANLGARVLIIDADMRKPRLHKIFSLDNRRGLSFFLSNNILLEEIIQPSEQENLWLLPSGLIPPNSSDLVSSDKMLMLLQQAVEQFDHILIDTPPVLGAPDPVIISRMVDGVILVVQGDRATREMLRSSTGELKKVGAKIFGTVLNKVKARQDRYDSYYYYYQYYSQENGDESSAEASKSKRQ